MNDIPDHGPQGPTRQAVGLVDRTDAVADKGTRMTKQQLKQRVCQLVDRRSEEIIAIGERIWRTPELGFREHRTAALVSETFTRLGLPHRERCALTGVTARVEGGTPGPTVALLGEMDGIILHDHPAADPETGAVHACGHNAQIAGLLGAAMALADADVANHLAGAVALMAVPAEEYLDIDYRRRLVREEQIEFLGGKCELIRLGCFDGVDMAMMVHTANGRGAGARTSMNGFVAKHVRYTGTAAHAGMSPQDGVNALNAAMLGLFAIHAQRETFADADAVRVHPIITSGGGAVNVVPDNVVVETLVRARTLEAIREAGKKVDRALQSGADAVGAQVAIDTLPGYLPLVSDDALTGLFKRNVLPHIAKDDFSVRGHLASSTDMGDVSQIMPAIHPNIGGADGLPHSAAFRIADPVLAYVVPAKVLAMTLVDLLADDAVEARRVIDGAAPALTKQEYLAYMRATAAASTGSSAT